VNPKQINVGGQVVPPFVYCSECNQPIKPGRHKPGEYAHARGCPKDRSRMAGLTIAEVLKLEERR